MTPDETPALAPDRTPGTAGGESPTATSGRTVRAASRNVQAARTVAVVLAAGDATRFGSVKLLADLDGRPMLQHVLDAVAAAGIDAVVVVLGRAAADVEQAVSWRTERRVTNEAPERGLSSSLQLGIAAAEQLGGAIDSALILLGDQPRVRSEVIVGLLAGVDADRPIVLPAYADGGGANPVLLRRDAWPLVSELSGDRGLGPLIARRPDLVREVPAPGDNPDVDVPADLIALSATRPDVAAAAGGSREVRT